MSKFFAVIIILSHSLCYANWIWTPESGWINTQYNPRAKAQTLYAQAQKLLEQKQYAQAIPLLTDIVKKYPNTPEGKESLYILADCQYNTEKYYPAYLSYKEYLEKYPQTPQRARILEQQYHIGAILIRGKGEKKEVLGVKLLPSAPLGEEILREVIKLAPYADYSDDALLTIANYYFQKREYEEAKNQYAQLLKNYPKSEWSAVAQYQSAACSMRQFRGLSHDDVPLRIAKKKLERYQEKYPHGGQKDKAEKMYKQVCDQLAQKEYQIAIFYIDWRNIESAKTYLTYILEQYPETPTALRAKYTLAELKKNEQ